MIRPCLIGIASLITKLSVLRIDCPPSIPNRSATFLQRLMPRRSQCSVLSSQSRLRLFMHFDGREQTDPEKVRKRRCFLWGIVTGRYPRARAAYYFNNASLFGHARQVLSFDNLIFGICGTPQAHLANVGHCGVAEQLPHVIR